MPEYPQQFQISMFGIMIMWGGGGRNGAKDGSDGHFGRLHTDTYDSVIL